MKKNKNFAEQKYSEDIEKFFCLSSGNPILYNVDR